jgi:hypothetical protein
MPLCVLGPCLPNLFTPYSSLSDLLKSVFFPSAILYAPCSYLLTTAPIVLHLSPAVVKSSAHHTGIPGSSNHCCLCPLGHTSPLPMAPQSESTDRRHRGLLKAISRSMLQASLSLSLCVEVTASHHRQPLLGLLGLSSAWTKAILIDAS